MSEPPPTEGAPRGGPVEGSEPLADPAAITRLLSHEARRAGFHRFGVAPAHPWARFGEYERFLDEGRAGEMGWLVEQAAPRRDVRALLVSARSVVTVGLSYAHPDRPPRDDGAKAAFIARYARGADYHQVLKRRLQLMAAAVAERVGRAVAWTACVDTAPLLEREAAHEGGVGFIGKNTMVIAPGLGSYLLLGELLVDLDAEPTAPAETRCGQCTACLDACPTGAFDDAFRLDPRRCISYLTIEHKGPIPRALRPLLGDMVFGCDRCQEACPWNAGVGLGHALPADPALAPHPRRDRPSLAALMTIGAAQFRNLVEKSAMRRIHRAQLLRNVAVALGNVGGPSEVAPLADALAEESALVREHAAWALGRIGARHPASDAHAALHKQAAIEPDDGVRTEIARALAGA